MSVGLNKKRTPAFVRACFIRKLAVKHVRPDWHGYLTHCIVPPEHTTSGRARQGGTTCRRVGGWAKVHCLVGFGGPSVSQKAETRRKEPRESTRRRSHFAHAGWTDRPRRRRPVYRPCARPDAAGGKPSAVKLPFLFLENRAGDTGLFVGIGWTGQWQAIIRADRSRQILSIRAGIPDLDLWLRPGEEISGPTVLLGGYHGPLNHGTNVLRRLIRDCYAPTVAGQPVSAPVLYTTRFDSIGAQGNRPD